MQRGRGREERVGIRTGCVGFLYGFPGRWVSIVASLCFIIINFIGMRFA